MTTLTQRWPALSPFNVVLAVVAVLLARFFTVLDYGRAGSRVEAIPLDYHIPFRPIAVLPYMSVYLLVAVTFLILARRKNPWPLTVFLLSFALLWSVADFVWSVYPTINVIRPEHLGHSWLERLVKFNYGPGSNTLPSGHNMTAWLCAFTLIAERTRRAWLFVVWAALVSIATLLVRQHYLADVAVSIPAAYGASYIVARAVTHQLRATPRTDGSWPPSGGGRQDP